MSWYCSICTDHFNEKSTFSTTPCGHVFHLECLRRWIRESETCPECRQSVSSSHLVKLHMNTEKDFDFKAMLNEKMEEIRKLGSQCRKAESEAEAHFLEKCKLELELMNADQFIKSLESKIENLLEINRCLTFENKHLNDVKTIVNGTQSEAEILLSSYSSNVDKEDVAKKLASFCTTLKCHLICVANEKKALEFNVQQLESECWQRTHEADKFMDQTLAAGCNAQELRAECSRKELQLHRVMGEKKALEFDLQQLRNEHRTQNSSITQLQKLVEKLKMDISLWETAKKDSSGYTYSKDTPSCDDEQEMHTTSKSMPTMCDLAETPTFKHCKLSSPVLKRKRNK